VERNGDLKRCYHHNVLHEKGGYDIESFLNELNSKVDTKKQFAIICRTGSRTSVVGAFLSQKLHYNVINLKGGVVFVKAKNLPMVPYK
jgi:rhodanese-related sulfurtransferase